MTIKTYSLKPSCGLLIPKSLNTSSVLAYRLITPIQGSERARLLAG